MKPEKMIRSILWWMFLGTILLFIFVWVLSGGPRQVWTKATEIAEFYMHTKESLPDASSGAGVLGILIQPQSAPWFKLPWQPQLPQGTIPTMADEYAVQTNTTIVSRDELPLNPEVRIKYVSPADTTEGEYVELQAEKQISLDKWTLRSSTGIVLPIPYAVENYTPDALNVQRPVTLTPGENVIIASGNSPVGTSFKEYSTWRLYMDSPRTLWRIDHDTIELRDARGALVDSYTY